MNLLVLMAGILLLCIVLLDALWTTLWTEGVAGPLSSRLARLLWQLWRKLFAGKRRTLFSVAGPFIMMSAVAMWAILMWLAWALIFSADPAALVNTDDKSSPGFLGRLYFAAMAIFTMGNGDIAPRTGGWRLATALANANGFLVLTLVISYVMSVLPAVVQKRLLARQIFSLGNSGPDIVVAGWNGKDCSNLELQLNTISSSMAQLTQQHMAYPVLHYFQSINSGASSVLAIAALEDAVDLLDYAVKPGHGISAAALRGVRSVVDNFADTIESMPVHAPTKAPATAEIGQLQQKGIPVVDAESFKQALEQRETVRSTIHGNLLDSGWEWPHQGYKESAAQKL